MIKRGIAQIAARVAGGEGGNTPPAQARHDIVDREAGPQDLRPILAHGGRDGESAARVRCREAPVLPAQLNLEAPRTPGDAKMQGEVGPGLRQQYVQLT